MLNIGQFIRWKNYNYENKIGVPIMKQEQLRNELHTPKYTKPDRYKSINSSGLQINK